MIFKNLYFSSFFVLGMSVFSLCSDVPYENPGTMQQKEKHACGSSILDSISPSIGGYSSTKNLPLTLNHKQESAVALINLIIKSDGEAPDSSEGICSGALIAPYYVLTAAHCLIHPPLRPEAVTNVVLPDQITVTFRPSPKDISPPTTILTIPAAQIFLHPDFPTTIKGIDEYKLIVATPGIDLAIIKLTQSPTEHGYEPLPLLFADSTSIDYNGQIALNAGFGKNTEYPIEGTAQRRWSLLFIGNYEDADFSISTIPETPTLAKNLFDVFHEDSETRNWYGIPEYLHISTCSGDSGGPLFFFDENKKPMVTGVLSSIISIFISSGENAPHSCLGSLSMFTSLHMNRKFITDIITTIIPIDKDNININNKTNSEKKPLALCANTGIKGICSQGYATYCDPDTKLLYSEPCFGQQVCGLDHNNNNRCIPCDQ